MKSVSFLKVIASSRTRRIRRMRGVVICDDDQFLIWKAKVEIGRSSSSGGIMVFVVVVVVVVVAADYQQYLWRWDLVWRWCCRQETSITSVYVCSKTAANWSVPSATVSGVLPQVFYGLHYDDVVILTPDVIGHVTIWSTICYFL